MASRDDLSTSFGSAADAYEAGRPGYPAEAVDWMLRPARRAGRVLRVADVGAGTGKLTRALVEAGAEVVAIDPDPAMLDALRTHVRGVPTFGGSAEALPLPDESVDAVVLGQAWHWVDPAAACTEVARVLRPGSVLGLVWNLRDDRVAWVRRLGEIMGGAHAEDFLAAGGPILAPPFDGLETFTHDWVQPTTAEGIRSLVQSRSRVITASVEARARIAQELEELWAQHPEVFKEAVALPFRTYAYRAVRP